MRRSAGTPSAGTARYPPLSGGSQSPLAHYSIVRRALHAWGVWHTGRAMAITLCRSKAEERSSPLWHHD